MRLISYYVGTTFVPTAVEKSQKYGGSGTATRSTFAGTSLPERTVQELAMWMNHSKAEKTWSTYRTAERMLKKCEQHNRTRFNWPLNQKDVLTFVHWLLAVRNLRSKTVNSYLAGVRQAHVARGIEPPVIRSEWVKQVLKGHENMERTSRKERDKKTRQAMSTKDMKRIKRRLKKSRMSKEEKCLVWCVCTVAFHGVFRIHEILSINQATFDKSTTLLTEDVTLAGKTGRRMLSIQLKCPKEKGAGQTTVVDVFETGSSICPVRAFARWAKKNGPVPGQPLFRKPCGTPLTGRELNKRLKELLPEANGSLTTHSFRSGVPTILAALGHEEEELKKVGRWSSRAFTAYVKGARTQRLQMAKTIKKLR